MKTAINENEANRQDLNFMLQLSETWGKEWFNKETWQRIELIKNRLNAEQNPELSVASKETSGNGNDGNQITTT